MAPRTPSGGACQLRWLGLTLYRRCVAVCAIPLPILRPMTDTPDKPWYRKGWGLALIAVALLAIMWTLWIYATRNLAEDIQNNPEPTEETYALPDSAR